jgi:tRNA threonylcarbamoyl adenosine modification protein (Sua5/YciO/YrdC/YwlC family)
METEIVNVPPGGFDPEEVRRVAALLRDGAIVGFPTETVYGLAARADDPDAVDRLRIVKGRPEDKPLTVHVGDLGDVLAGSAPLHPRARRLVDRLLPGPVTLVLPGADGEPTGFRLPDHAVAREFLRSAGVPVVATSANLSGEPPLTDGADVERAFDGRLGAILSAGPARYGRASTVVRVLGPEVEILREGVVPAEAVRAAAAYGVHFVCTGNLCRSPMAEGIFKHLVAERLGVEVDDLVANGVRIDSSGTAALTGDPASPPGVVAAAKWGADISEHVAQPLTPSLIRDADRIVTAARPHAETILTFTPEAYDRVRPMRRDGRDVKDPYGRSDREYRRTAAEIREEMTVLADEVVEIVRRESDG